MAGCCDHDHADTTDNHDPAWRRALWIALAVNAAMFVTEIAAGFAAGSAALQADALDFLGDSANYAISLMVVGLGLSWRARAALFKGLSLGALSLVVLATTVWHAYAGTLPAPAPMGVVGTAALIANAAVAVMLYRFRAGDANRRLVWICSRNDAIGNIAVLAAAAGVFGTGTAWPDLIVAAIMAALGISGAVQIIRHARADLRSAAQSHDAPHGDLQHSH